MGAELSGRIFPINVFLVMLVNVDLVERAISSPFCLASSFRRL